MFIGIVGARKYKDRQTVIEFVKRLPADSVIITGSCKGPCRWAASEAKSRGLRPIIFSPDLNNVHGKFEVAKRYYEKNRQLVQACNVLHAFISKEGGFTGGTRFEVEYALKIGTEVGLHWEGSICQSVCQNAFQFSHSGKRLFTSWQRFFVETFA